MKVHKDSATADEPAHDEHFQAGPSDEEPSSGDVSEGGSGDDIASELDEPASSGDEGEDLDVDEGDVMLMSGGEEDASDLAASEDDGEKDAQQDDAEGTAAGSDSDGAGDGQQPNVGFLKGGKGASFAKAFAKILENSSNRAAVVARQGGAAGPAAAAAPPILAASKSVAKRKAEEVVEQRADREARKLRQEMKVRGHAVPARRGQDPETDQREKALQRLATKGVVRLFNAIAKAQKQLRDAEEATGSRAKAVKLGKASFLAQLKRSSEAGQQEQQLVPSAPLQQQVGGTAAAGGSKKQQQQQRKAAAAESSSEDEDASGWDVLQQGFVGLQGGNKMKDWDKAAASDEDGSAGEQLGGSDEED